MLLLSVGYVISQTGSFSTDPEYYSAAIVNNIDSAGNLDVEYSVTIEPKLELKMPGVVNGDLTVNTSFAKDGSYKCDLKGTAVGESSASKYLLKGESFQKYFPSSKHLHVFPLGITKADFIINPFLVMRDSSGRTMVDYLKLIKKTSPKFNLTSDGRISLDCEIDLGKDQIAMVNLLAKFDPRSSDLPDYLKLSRGSTTLLECSIEHQRIANSDIFLPKTWLLTYFGNGKEMLVERGTLEKSTVRSSFVRSTSELDLPPDTVILDGISGEVRRLQMVSNGSTFLSSPVFITIVVCLIIVGSVLFFKKRKI
jgi:hypothetical protein